MNKHLRGERAMFFISQSFQKNQNQRKDTSLFPFILSVFVCFLLSSITSPVHILASSVDECSELLPDQGDRRPRKPVVKLDPKTHEFDGLTEEGLEALKEARDALQIRSKLFSQEFKSLDTIHHAGLVARLSRFHMFLYGPPGGAKTKFVTWLMKQGEKEHLYQLQLHQMLPEQAFIGGQNFKAAKEGRFEINTKGSLADHYIALLDEMEKGNPATLASILSLLNERQVLAGNQVIPAKLETLFATSNSNLPEIFQQFLEMGQSATAPALLNRFQFKAFVYNWLSMEDQVALDPSVLRKSYLEAMAETHPEVLRDATFIKPPPVNWSALREIAYALFKPEESFMAAYRSFVGDMRHQTNEAIHESEIKHQENHLDESFVYFPSADYTERLRQQIPQVVIMSALLDFIMSPLVSDVNLIQAVQKPILLDPLSLWRAYLIMTTLGPGRTRLILDSKGKKSKKSKNKLDVDFGWSVDPSLARDQREKLLIENLQSEQDRFRRTFETTIASYKDQIELRSSHSRSDDLSHALENTSFEYLLLSLKRGQEQE